MKPEEMQKRLQNGESPLELSIEKWEDLASGKNEDYGPANCGLCEVYLDLDCKGCPVAETGHHVCRETPYEDFEDLVLERKGLGKITAEMRAVARKEVAFLKSLRKE